MPSMGRGSAWQRLPTAEAGSDVPPSSSGTSTRFVQTGLFCAYAPDPTFPVDWEL
jgi:hypothetical protein